MSIQKFSSAAIVLLLAAFVWAGCSAPRGTVTDAEPEVAGPAPIRVLMVTATHGYRHTEAIAAAKDVLQAAADSTELDVTVTEDVADFTEENLAGYDVILLANSSLRLDGGAAYAKEQGAAFDGQSMTAAQQQALLDFLAAGKGIAAVHAAADAFYEWDAYHELLGARYQAHPYDQEVRVLVEDAANPAMTHFGDSFTITDEIYEFDANPRWSSHVLASLDMRSVGEPEGPGDFTSNDFPVAWLRRYNGGRVFYTMLGHYADVWRNPAFQRHLLQGIRIAAGRLDADFGGRRVKEVIAENVWPDDLAVDDQNNVWIVELRGRVFRYDNATGQTRQVGFVNTTDPEKIEHGLYGIEIDPNFYDEIGRAHV